MNINYGSFGCSKFAELFPSNRLGIYEGCVRQDTRQTVSGLRTEGKAGLNQVLL